MPHMEGEAVTSPRAFDPSVALPQLMFAARARVAQSRQCRPRSACFVVACCLLTFMLVHPLLAYADYTFTVIADNSTNSDFQFLGQPTINTNGEVVFNAQLKSDGSGIYRWSGGQIVP